MEFLTEEEEFDLRYQDEMDALDDMDGTDDVNCPNSAVPQHSNSDKNKLANTVGVQSNKIVVEYINDENCDPLTKITENEYSLSSNMQTTNKRAFSEVFDLEELEPTNIKKKRHCVSLDFNAAPLNDEDQPPPSIPSPIVTRRTFLTEQQSLTKSDGQRLYFSVHDDNDEEYINIPGFSQRTNSLLPMSISCLKSQLSMLREVQLLQETQNDARETNLIQDQHTVIEEEANETSLWVEKYRPLSYMHLLSEEGINRTLLQWLKQWDKVVFGKEKKNQKKKVAATVPPKFHKNFGELIDEPDEHGRPFHKVAFLCGPPGLGKTTLAIIIAKHVGYNIVELNASDDRNPEAFRTSLEAATQMKSVLHEDRRPNCLILDEIDGAPSPSINVLLQFIKSPGIPKGKRKKGDIPLLTRPIICICNDQYSVTLRPLRQIALVLNFPPTAPPRLTSRLNEVAIKEGLYADIAALTLLCEKAGNDIRSCLSTLQFIHRKKKELKLSDVTGLKIGQKDMHKSLFAVWQDIFHVKATKSFTNIFNTVQAFGDYEKVFVGMFENYVNIKFKGRNSESLWKGPEWMCFGDIIQQQIAQGQLYLLMPYLPYPAVAFHLLYASTAYAHVTYPTAFYECRSKATQLSNTLTSSMKEISSSLKTFLNPSVVIEDILPFLVEVIKPTLRPVNTHLYSEREKKELQRVIELMLSFNINYRQERQQNGTYAYVLDPNLEELIRFSEMKPKRELSYAAKQLIAREVEVERMRKGDATEKAKEKTEKVPIVKPVEVVPLVKPKEKIAASVEKPTYDFFGRKIDVPAGNKISAKDEKSGEIWFHFKEGYSNAVRRTVYIKDLI